MASITLLARAYQQSFDSRPYSTLAVTNASLSALGDIIAQASTILTTNPHPHEDPPKYDPHRTLRFFTFGLAMGPILGRWNKLLELHFPLRVSGVASNRPSLRAIGKRVVADQLFMAPIGLTLFLGSMGVMEGQDSHHIQQKFSDLYSRALISNWQVWPLAQFINFGFMPLAYRVPFQSSLGIFWNLYLSLLNSSETRTQTMHDALHKTLEN